MSRKERKKRFNELVHKKVLTQEETFEQTRILMLESYYNGRRASLNELLLYLSLFSTIYHLFNIFVK